MTRRDFVMARIGAALCQLRSTTEQLEDVMSMMVDPALVEEAEGDDPRDEALESAELFARALVEEIQVAREMYGQLSAAELEMSEDDILGGDDDANEAG